MDRAKGDVNQATVEECMASYELAVLGTSESIDIRYLCPQWKRCNGKKSDTDERDSLYNRGDRHPANDF